MHIDLCSTAQTLNGTKQSPTVLLLWRLQDTRWTTILASSIANVSKIPVHSFSTFPTILHGGPIPVVHLLLPCYLYEYSHHSRTLFVVELFARLSRNLSNLAVSFSKAPDSWMAWWISKNNKWLKQKLHFYDAVLQLQNWIKVWWFW